MIVDCGRCDKPGPAQGQPAECHGCLVGTLMNTPDGIEDLTPGELRAIEVFELAGFEVELLETPDPPVVVPMYPRARHVA
ncbi:hypothetical protein [Actinoplanes sp. M2I2]|uniref:hypothetical protein n=1 Tax=Actinoplanes sp. M2I2 TaxID=1734444 RepID=UPI002021298A|nr:hypothetical protein [Actinoplanes sp. M2I2]